MKCGRVLVAERPEYLDQIEREPLRRSLEFERGVTVQATKGVIDPTALIEHSEIRADKLSGEYVSDPMHILPGRDRARDVREEIADARNHALWLIQENIGDEDRADDWLIGLRFLALAYERFRQVA